jgi:hypothetical protein
MKTSFRLAVVSALLFGLPAAVRPASAQVSTPHAIRGVVIALNGTPIAGVNILLLEAADVAITDTDGRFTIRTTAQGTVTVVARRIGFAPAAVETPVDTNGTLSLTMIVQAAVLVPITARAGEYTAGNERGATGGGISSTSV